MDEVDIENWVVEKAANELGVPSLKLNVQGNRKWPDRLFVLMDGHALFVEFKKPGEEPDKGQAVKLTMLRHRGFNVQVHDNREEALQAVKIAMEASQVPTAGAPVPPRARSRRALP